MTPSLPTGRAYVPQWAARDSYSHLLQLWRPPDLQPELPPMPVSSLFTVRPFHTLTPGQVLPHGPIGAPTPTAERTAATPDHDEQATLCRPPSTPPAAPWPTSTQTRVSGHMRCMWQGTQDNECQSIVLRSAENSRWEGGTGTAGTWREKLQPPGTTLGPPHGAAHTGSRGSRKDVCILSA